MNRAFSLTELLVVIVIIAVLAAFLFPVGVQARTSAKVTACISNMHQMYVATELYMNDFGDLPPVHNQGVLTRLYLGGVKLKCFAAPPGYLTYEDYNVTTVPNPAFAPMHLGEQYVKEWLDCRAKRGPDFPLVRDRNHTSTVEAYKEGGTPFFLIARDSGQVQRVPYEVLAGFMSGASKPPCAVDLLDLNL